MYRVLIADDEITVCRGLAQLIDWEEYGFTVEGFAHDGQAAFYRVIEMRPDLLLSDVRMPAMDGLELVQRLRARKFGGKVVILSAYAEFEYAQTAIQFDVKRYLLKPVSTELLIEALHGIKAELDREYKPLPQSPPAPGGYHFPPSSAEVPDEKAERTVPPTGNPVETVIAFVREHYAEDISLLLIAKQLYMNPAYLGRLFKSATGSSFTEYLNYVRINQAVELLAVRECMIYEICSRVGYQDLNYFYRMFKKKMGVTPTEYRNQLL